jgi:hypothetical protein
MTGRLSSFPSSQSSMSNPIFTFHLVETNIINTIGLLCCPPKPSQHPGLISAECLATMKLGAPILSGARLQLQNLVLFAAWESHTAIDNFLLYTKPGQLFSAGWYLRMVLLRRWGSIEAFEGIGESQDEIETESPVVAVTLARMRMLEIPRFIRWGRPVEEMVRDHPSARLAMAAMRLPRTVSTFSIWNSQKEMLDMVHGRTLTPLPDRHARAMRERNKKDFHHEFATFRFKPISEHGYWMGQSHWIAPNL